MTHDLCFRPSPSRPRVPAALLRACTSVLLWGSLAACGGEPEFHGTAYVPAELAPGFRLVDHTGQPARLDQFRGEPVLLFFGFTHCPDVCPLTLDRLHAALGSMGEDARDIPVLLVTTDPTRDTPRALARYVERFGGRVTGLTGDADTLAAIRQAYGAHASAPTADADTGGGHGAMMHTDAVFGIDGAGQLRVLMQPDAPEEHIRDDVRTLLRL